MAFDASGRVYVANLGTNTVTVYAFNPVGSVTSAPVASLGGTNTALIDPRGMTFDSSGYLYVANQASNQFLVFAPGANGNVAPVATVPAAYGLDVALDSSGRVYDAEYEEHAITIFAAYPSLTALATISGASTGVNAPYSVALDSSVRVYVANIGTDTVTAFPAYPAAGNEAPFATISNAAITAPTGIALDSSGRIYISNGSNPGQILVFAANPVGNVTGAPIATLTSGLGENQLLTAR